MSEIFSQGMSVTSRNNAADPSQVAMPGRRDPVVWLIACGILLVTAIILGTMMMVGEFRERALANSERELENTVLLLTRHFDQQFADYQILNRELISRTDDTQFESPEAFKERMFGVAAYERLKAQINALPYVDDVNIYDSDGELINTSSAWPPPARTGAAPTAPGTPAWRRTGAACRSPKAAAPPALRSADTPPAAAHTRKIPGSPTAR